MGSLSKRQKEQQKYRLPECNTSEEQQKYYDYCVKNNIIISPVAVKDTIGSWAVGISVPGNHRVIHKSPEICDKHSIMEVMYRYCLYYYNKRK